MRKPKELDLCINGFKVIRDLGYIKNGTRYAIFECKECGKEFQSQVVLAKTRKSCGCILPYRSTMLPDFINGFRIVKDLGRTLNKDRRIALVECKVCFRIYEAEPYQLKNRESCNCRVAGTKVSKYVHDYPDLLHTLRRMKSRCNNKKNSDYYNYGGRGIMVCDEWINNQDAFVEWSLKNGWEKGLSIDRINNNYGYNPENCKWSTIIEQARNKRNNKFNLEKAENVRLKYKEGISVKELSIIYDTCPTNVRHIIHNRTWKNY